MSGVGIAIDILLGLIGAAILLSVASWGLASTQQYDIAYRREVEARQQIRAYYEYAAYDNTIVSGAQVIAVSLISHQDDIGIRILGPALEFYWKEEAGLFTKLTVNMEAHENALLNHVKPTAEYSAKLIYDGNNRIGLIEFEEVSPP